MIRPVTNCVISDHSIHCAEVQTDVVAFIPIQQPTVYYHSCSLRCTFYVPVQSVQHDVESLNFAFCRRTVKSGV